MLMKKIISPSMLSADFANLERDLKMTKEAGADWLHVDVMDGHYVPNITIGPNQVGCLRKISDLFFDVHLMITHPLAYVKAFAENGADLISFHVDTEDDTREVIQIIKATGRHVGLVLSPDVPLEAITPYLDDIALVLMMGVYPGFGGQSYIQETTARIKKMKAIIGTRAIRVEVDGGVNFETLPEMIEAGADTIVSGSCLFKGDMVENIKRFRKIMD